MNFLKKLVWMVVLGLFLCGCSHETTYKKTLVNETGQDLTIRFFSQRFPELNADFTFPDATSRVFFTYRKTASDPGNFFNCHFEIDSFQVLSPAGSTIVKDLWQDANWDLDQTELNRATEYNCEFLLSPTDLQ